MTKTETAAVLAVIRTAYPRYYDNKTKKELEETVSLWQTMLEEYPAETVGAAVKSIIAASKFPPSIAEVIEMINTLTRPAELGEIEAWGLVKNAIRDSAYHSAEEFAKLPEAVRETLGGPGVLREWAMSGDSGMENTIASNFMRAYRARLETRRAKAALPAGVKALMGDEGTLMIGEKTEG